MTTVHIDQLVAKVLCKKHNSEVSELDNALIQLVNSMREVERLRGIREQSKRRSHRTVKFVVDGLSVERCVLKMVMNYAAVMHEPLNDWRPPPWMPDVIFGSRSLPEGCGLFSLARVGDEVVDSERVGFTFGLGSDRAPVAVLLELRKGWKFLCTWDRPHAELGLLRFQDGTDYEPLADALFHPRRMLINKGTVPLGLSIDFDWSGRLPKSHHVIAASLRGKYRAPPRKGRR